MKILHRIYIQQTVLIEKILLEQLFKINLLKNQNNLIVVN
jgi:hypothetical protein